MLDVLANTYRIATRLDDTESPSLAPRTGHEASAREHTPQRRPGRIAGFFAWLGRRRARARARAEVLALSERTLRDIGWTRQDLLNQIDNRRE